MILHLILFSITISYDNSLVTSILLSKPLKLSPGFQQFVQLPTLIKLTLFPNRLNDTSILQQAALATNVSPPWNVPGFIWDFAWKLHNFLMPFLHFFDNIGTYPTKNHCFNLAVLWWKSIAANRKGTPTYDDGIAYDLLPPRTRCIVRWPWCWLYPNLHHQSIAIRTVFLNNAIKKELSNNSDKDNNIIVLGAGFDTRALRFLQEYNNSSFRSSWFEMDLPGVIEQKRLLLNRYRQRRRICSSLIPHLIGADLNDNVAISMHLNELFENLKKSKSKGQHTTFLFEAVMIYLNQEGITNLLDTCIKTAAKYSNSVSICFADKLPLNSTTLTGGRNRDVSAEYDVVQNYFKNFNMDLVEYLPKPGMARHMGIARLKTHNT